MCNHVTVLCSQRITSVQQAFSLTTQLHCCVCYYDHEIIESSVLDIKI